MKTSEVSLSFVKDTKDLLDEAVALCALENAHEENFEFDCFEARARHTIGEWASLRKQGAIAEIEKRLKQIG